MIANNFPSWFEVAWLIQNASRVQINQRLFIAIAAGYTPNSSLLVLACFLAQYGGWFAYGAMIWALWRMPQRRSYVLSILVISGLASIAAHALANSIGHPRPFMIGLSPSYIPHAARGSLPSAHATVLWTLTFISLQSRGLRRLGFWIGFCALATSWARIYTGLHFPLDIFGGIILAAIIAINFSFLRLIWLHIFPKL